MRHNGVALPPYLIDIWRTFTPKHSPSILICRHPVLVRALFENISVLLKGHFLGMETKETRRVLSSVG